MKDRKSNFTLGLSGLLAALGASLCCITPVLALLAGLGGAASAFAWLDPLRPYLIIFTGGVLAFAWYRKVKPQVRNSECDCSDEAQPEPFIHSKAFLGIISVLAVLLLTFPNYADSIVQKQTSETAVIGVEPLEQVQISIEGMTCSGCELTVNRALMNKEGVVRAEASYDEARAIVTYNARLLDPTLLKEVIEKEVGYQVVALKKLDLK